MSEKHLMELPWKTLVTKAKFKDPGLHKALAAYANIDSKQDATSALQALEEITLQATKLKKANPALHEITDYLEEVVKESTKARQGLAVLAKSQAAGGMRQAEGKAEQKGPVKGQTPEEPEDPGLKGRLINALKKVKAGQGEESIAFVVCVAKPFYGVLLAKSPSERVGAAQKKELTELTKGTKFVEGMCVFEKEAHTFVVKAVPAGLAKNLKKALKQYTELNYKVRVRDIEGQVVTDGDTEIDPEETSGAAMAQFTARFKGLQPDILKAIASKTAQGDRVKLRSSEAGAVARQGNFAQAHEILDEVETLLKSPGSGTPAGSAPKAMGSQVAFAKLRLEWEAQKNAVAKQLETLRTTILAEYPDPESAASAAKLKQILARFSKGLSKNLDDVYTAADEVSQTKFRQASVGIIGEYLSYVETDPLISHVEVNPFLAVNVRGALSSALQGLKTQLQRGA